MDESRDFSLGDSRVEVTSNKCSNEKNFYSYIVIIRTYLFC
jgi:hypothetical protein